MILNSVPWKLTEIILLFLRLHPSTATQTLLWTMMVTPTSKGFLSTLVDVIVIWVKFTHFSPFLIHWFLKYRCLLLPSPFDHFPFALVHGPNIPGSYVILFLTALDFTSICCHTHNWVLFLLYLHFFILSGVISPVIPSSILGTYKPGEFIFQCPIFLPFHTVHGALKARILKWLVSPFSSGPCFFKTPYHDPSILGDPIGHHS